MQQKHLTPVRECDYLEQDPPLRGQNFACVSFLNPEDVALTRTEFEMAEFMAHAARELRVAVDALAARDPDAATALRERAPQLLADPDATAAEFRAFRARESARLERSFGERSEFRTSVRGLKIRGVFDTLPEAEARARKLKDVDNTFDIFVASVGAWCPWCPHPDEIPDCEYAETQLNTLMREYRANIDKKQAYEVERQRLMREAAARPPAEPESEPAAPTPEPEAEAEAK